MPRHVHRVARRRAKVSGLLGPVLLTPQPARIEGTRQRAGEVTPPACPHCRAEPPMWSTDAWAGQCRACGATWFKTAHIYQPPAPPHYAAPAHRLPNMKGA